MEYSIEQRTKALNELIAGNLNIKKLPAFTEP